MRNAYLWDMEKLFWYPGAEIRPIAENEKECWEEYRFSEIAKKNGFEIIRIELHYGSERVDVPSVRNIMKARSFWVAGVRVKDADGKLFNCFIAPGIFRGMRDSKLISPLDIYSDLVVRYYVLGEKVLRPVWSKLISSGVELMCSGDDVLYFSGMIGNGWLSGIGERIMPERSFMIER